MDAQYILFDLDGTLTDPREGITNAVAYALSRFGIEVPDRNTLIPFIGPPLLDSFRRFYGFDTQQALRAVEEYRVYFSKTGIFENAVLDGAPALLRALRTAGYTLVLATSKPEIYARQILCHFGLDRYFDHICGATMDSSRSAKADVIAYALRTAGVTDPGQAVMVGDRRHDIEGAHACGIPAIGLLCGYGSRQELEDAGADHILPDLFALKEFLRPDAPARPESSVIFFPCRSIPETTAYYRDVLGLPVYKALEGCVWLDCVHGYLAFCDYGPDRPMATGACISFNLPSTAAVDAMYEQLRRRPVIGLGDRPAHHPRFPVYSFFLSDPNGYTLEYQKTTDEEGR